jgi:hypothetical protein
MSIWTEIHKEAIEDDQWPSYLRLASGCPSREGQDQRHERVLGQVPQNLLRYRKPKENIIGFNAIRGHR